MAAQSKALVCGRSLVGIVGSNPTGGMDVFCERFVLAGRGLLDGPIPHPEEPFRVCLCMSECVISKLQQWDGLSPSRDDETIPHLEENYQMCLCISECVISKFEQWDDLRPIRGVGPIPHPAETCRMCLCISEYVNSKPQQWDGLRPSRGDGPIPYPAETSECVCVYMNVWSQNLNSETVYARIGATGWSLMQRRLSECVCVCLSVWYRNLNSETAYARADLLCH